MYKFLKLEIEKSLTLILKIHAYFVFSTHTGYKTAHKIPGPNPESFWLKQKTTNVLQKYLRFVKNQTPSSGSFRLNRVDDIESVLNTHDCF